MTDKEKIKAELERRMYDDYNNGEAEVDCVAQGVCASMIQFIDSLPEEPVSEDLEKAAEEYTKDDTLKPWRNLCEEAFKAGAQWQKEQLPKWKRFANVTCWSGEIGCKPTGRKFTYENYSINADKLYKILDKEDKL